MKLVVLLYQRKSLLFDPLLAAFQRYRIPIHLHAWPTQDLASALRGLAPLGLHAAILEDPLLPQQALHLVDRQDPEAQGAGRVDLVLAEHFGLFGNYSEAPALASLLRQHALGLRALWLGPPRPELKGGLKVLAQVSVLAESYAEGEAWLRLLPHPQRGRVAVGAVQGAALAREVDLLIHAGGPLSSILQPYHTVFSLQGLSQEQLRWGGGYIGPEELRAYRLAHLSEALGYPLPPQAFVIIS
jgi:hypothetical protein